MISRVMDQWREKMRSAAAIAISVLVASLMATPSSGAAPLSDFAKRILAAHNGERVALGIPRLAWSETLAAHAAVWADALAKSGKFQHSPASMRPGEGENLWIGTAGAYEPEEMVKAWADEQEFFQYGPFAPDGPHVVGHFTQVVWRTTTELGCAEATGNGADVLVCRYSPPGNMIGEKPY